MFKTKPQFLLTSPTSLKWHCELQLCPEHAFPKFIILPCTLATKVVDADSRFANSHVWAGSMPVLMQINSVQRSLSESNSSSYSLHILH